MPQLSIRKINANNGTALPGAVFQVAEKNSSEYTNITTGANGTATLNLAPGWYIVTETRAPTGFELDATPREIEIKPGENVAITVNNSKLPQLTIHKVDEQTGEGLSGAILRVTRGAEYKDVTTGKSGVAVLTGLAPGWYTVTERQAPTGYLLDTTPRVIQLKAGQDAELVVQNRRRPSLSIVKIDDITKQPLRYAKFRVSIKEGRTLGEYTTDAEGKIVLPNLDPALYVVEEITPPNGYNILDGTKEIRVEWGTDEVIEIPNQPVNPLLIKKVDAVSGEPLSGAKFRICVQQAAKQQYIPTI
jgi:uncharacterized surface anchored protein